jgi:hypothetical protein
MRRFGSLSRSSNSSVSLAEYVQNGKLTMVVVDMGEKE